MLVVETAKKAASITLRMTDDGRFRFGVPNI